MSKNVSNSKNKDCQQYEVQRILDRRVNQEDCYFYHIKWVGYSQTTWEPLSNLLGAQGVQKMIANFEKNLEKKTKKNWSKGLQGWANISKIPVKQIEKIARYDLDETFYKASQNDIIDLQKLDQPVIIRKKPEGNPFIGSKVRMKITTNKHEKYPFDKVGQTYELPNFMKKVIEIKKIEIVEGQFRCLTVVKNPQIHEEWLPSEIVRLIAPELLLENYQKVYNKNQLKNKNPK